MENGMCAGRMIMLDKLPADGVGTSSLLQMLTTSSSLLDILIAVA
jgi:hypothetical protein